MFKKIFQHFFKTNCLDSAAVLSFSTILALVPTLSLMLSIFSISPYFKTLQIKFEQFLFNNLLPENYQVVEQYLHQFITQTSQLTTISTVFLIVSAILLFFEIDKKINRIWRSSYQRHWLTSLSFYSFILFFAPFILGFSLFLTSYFSLLNTGVLTDLFAFLSSSLGFAIFFTIIPIAKVTFKSALKAGVITALGLEILKFAIGVFINNFPSYQIIYGAFASLPLFILWIYSVWIIILFGATCCYQFDEKSH